MKPINITRKIAGILLMSLMTLAACSSEESAMENSSKDNLSAVEMEVKGMVCEMGCVSSIKKELKGLEGISNYSIDFESGTAKVEFYNTKISKEEVVRSIESLNEGMYKVENLKEVCAVDCGETDENEKDSSKSTNEPQAMLDGFQLPNFFNLINSLIR